MHPKRPSSINSRELRKRGGIPDKSAPWISASGGAEAVPPNQGLVLTSPDAAHSVLRPPCLLSGLAAQPRVGWTENARRITCCSRTTPATQRFTVMEIRVTSRWRTSRHFDVTTDVATTPTYLSTTLRSTNNRRLRPTPRRDASRIGNSFIIAAALDTRRSRSSKRTRQLRRMPMREKPQLSSRDLLVPA